MKTSIHSKPFKTGGSVAVRIPSQFNLELGDEVTISSPKSGVIVIEIKENLWEKQLESAVSEAANSGIWDDTVEPADHQPEPIKSW